MSVQDIRAEVIVRRTYARPKEDGDFETWPETVDRVIQHQSWLWNRATESDKNAIPSLSIKETDELEDFRQLMLDKKATTSGRTLWLGGTNIAKTRESSQFNPLKRDTKFITDEGVKSFEDFEHGDSCRVLTHKGNIKQAVVTNSGTRKMLKLTFNRGRTVNTVDSAIEHNWILKDGTKVEAKDLKIGDKIYRAPSQSFYDWKFEEALTDEQFWWCYGFVYGDGAIAKSGNSITSRVRLCGNKKKHFTKFLDCGFEYSFPPSCAEDPFVYTGKYLKKLPDNSTEPRLHKAFLHGYLAADGHKVVRHGKEVITDIVTKDLEAKEYIEKWMPLFNVYIANSKRDIRKTNYGTFDGYKISFTTFQSLGGNLYKVKNIETIPDELCYCLTVEDDASFVLPSGITTSNCSYTKVETVYDVVDVLWLLLQGCGVGFSPVIGTLNGFLKPIKNIEVINSTREVDADGNFERGEEHNIETVIDRVWTIKVGDSAEAWAKSIGKLMAGKQAVDKLVLDFSNIRPAGIRLKGYGWISSGDTSIAKAYVKIAEILNRRAGQLLNRIDILDVVNWLGTVLSSRRSAQIALFEYGEPEWKEFAVAKKEWWLTGNEQRIQSNNSLKFHKKPTRLELEDIFSLMKEAGGSEPGFVNAETALKRAPWFSGSNPCVEILLGNKNFCNLMEIDIAKFKGDSAGLLEAIRLAARANYRQTCVDLKDGILQEAWHLNNEFLRLCGVGLTGIARRNDLSEYDYEQMKLAAVAGAYSMADELGLQRPKNVTTIKPSGTLSKIMSTSEGVHKPLGKYIFNNINFGKHDPLLSILKDANYEVYPNPADSEGILVTFPVAWEDIEFTKVQTDHGEVEINLETAIEQLERYKKIQIHYCQQNVSNTISYSLDEVPAIIDWLLNNWEIYVGVSFLYRTDPSKTAEDLGYLYLPQEVVTKDKYEKYINKLLPVDLGTKNKNGDIEIESQECASGSCPVK